MNVLGRWTSLDDWNHLGVLVEMDALFTATGHVQDGPALQAAWARWEAAHETSLWAPGNFALGFWKPNSAPSLSSLNLATARHLET